MKCALTGHRRVATDFSVALLEEKLEDLIQKGVDTFYCGMAEGFDLIACRVLANLKKDYPISIVACIPFVGQAEKFSPENQREYASLLEICTEKVVLAPKYQESCFFDRNRYMVDHADFVLAYLIPGNERSGTGQTVRYAKKKGKEVVLFP